MRWRSCSRTRARADASAMQPRPRDRAPPVPRDGPGSARGAPPGDPGPAQAREDRSARLHQPFWHWPRRPEPSFPPPPRRTSSSALRAKAMDRRYRSARAPGASPFRLSGSKPAATRGRHPHVTQRRSFRCRSRGWRRGQAARRTVRPVPVQPVRYRYRARRRAGWCAAGRPGGPRWIRGDARRLPTGRRAAAARGRTRRSRARDREGRRDRPPVAPTAAAAPVTGFKPSKKRGVLATHPCAGYRGQPPDVVRCRHGRHR